MVGLNNKNTSLRVAVPWSLSYYFPLNGFHPLYRALFDQRPDFVKIMAWDNVKLQNHLINNPEIVKGLLEEIQQEEMESRKIEKDSIGQESNNYVSPSNRVMTRSLSGDIEFLHTAPFPSWTRPFVFHCEMFSPIFFPFSHQGTGDFDDKEKIRKHYQEIFSSPLCLGIFSHIQETLDNIKIFFDNTIINEKLSLIRIGLSEKSYSGTEDNDDFNNNNPSFVFINSAHQKIDNFFNRGGHIVLNFWELFKNKSQNGTLYLRCQKPNDLDLTSHGVNLNFLKSESGKSIVWIEDYLDSTDLNRLIEWSDFFLLPSMSLHSASILQAMQRGSVPIVTDTMGISNFITDGDNGIILKGMKEAIWHKDSNTGLMFDNYVRNKDLDNSLSTQLLERILSNINSPDAYTKIRTSALSYSKNKFSGNLFSSEFWNTVSILYQTYLKENPYFIPKTIPSRDMLSGCALGEDSWERVFAGVTQPVEKIWDGYNMIWSLSGAYVSHPHRLDLQLNNWDIMRRHTHSDEHLLTHVNNISEINSMLDLVEIQTRINPLDNKINLLVKRISRLLSGYPKAHYLAKYVFLKFGFLFLLPIYKGIHEMFLRPPELVDQGIHEFNIIRYGNRFYGIHQSEGAFDPSVMKEGGYKKIFWGYRAEAVIKQIEKYVSNVK